MIRGHECIQGGFLVEQYCITVFSAPDYCGSLTNRGATVCISKDLKISFKVILSKIFYITKNALKFNAFFVFLYLNFRINRSIISMFAIYTYLIYKEIII